MTALGSRVDLAFDATSHPSQALLIWRKLDITYQKHSVAEIFGCGRWVGQRMEPRVLPCVGRMASCGQSWLAVVARSAPGQAARCTLVMVSIRDTCATLQ